MNQRQTGLKHSLLCSLILLFATPVHGQIIPDNTLGAENSRLTPNVQIQGAAADRIEGGAQRGSNLFHSFSQFSVNDGQRAYFVNPIGVENILTRVTGGQASNILGTLGVEGSANLFLLNPNGILFGPNARLDVSGSFVGTTANAFRFGEQGIFSATNPSAPPLLTINPSAFLFNQLNPKAITNQSQASAGINPVGANVTGLRVGDGKSLLLVGGNINFDSGALRAYGGNIELAALAAPGDVGLNVAGGNLSLTLPNGVERGDISLTNGAEVNVRGADAGSIKIHARNLNLAGASKLRAGIDTGLGTPNSKALDIDINATGTITLTNTSFIANVPQATSLGNGGNINITAGSLTLLDGSALNTNNFGQGDGGNVNLNIRDRLTIAGVNRDGLGSAILSSVQSQAVGQGGSINITAGSLSLSDGAFLSASTFGQGNAGSISIQARDAVSLSYSDIYSNVEAGGVGNGGNINIGAGVLTLKDGSQLQTLLRDSENNLPGGRGNAGNVNVDVLGEVNISGQKNGFSSSIRSRVGTGAEGNGGNINLKSGSLSLTDNAALDASTFGKGDAGSISIQARDTVSLSYSNIFSNVEAGGVGNGGNINIGAGVLTLKDGSQLQTLLRDSENNLPGGRGNAGNVNVDVLGEVNISGQKNGFSSSIRSRVGTGAEGNGGNINLKSGSLSLTDGAFLSASTFGQGNAGSISIQARDAVSLSDGDIYSNVEAGGIGNGGSINIRASVLTLKDGSQLQTLLRDADSENKLPGGRGNAGNVNVDVLGEVNISGQKNGFNSSIRSRVGTGAEGNGGNINLKSGSLSLTDGALLTASTFGQGNAGSISIQAKDSISLSYSDIYSNVEAGGVGNGGNINIGAGVLTLKDGSQLQTLLRDSENNLPGGRGNAGNVNVDVLGEVNISGEKNGFNSSIRSLVGTGAEGNGGNINLKSGSLSLTDGGLLTASTFGKGDAGNILIDTRDRVSFDGRGSNQNPTGAYTTFESFEVGKAGNIELRTGSLFLSNGAQLAASTFGKGNGGNIIVNALETVKIEGIGNNGRSSGLFSTVESNGVGDAGNIELRTGSLFLSNRGLINASTFGQGNAGNIFVNVNGELKLNEGYIVTIVSSGGAGNAGNIDIQAQALSLLNGSEIDSVLLRSTQNLPAARGRSGNIRINTTDSVTLSGISSRGFSSAIFTASDRGTSGAAGDITINTGTFRVSDGAIVSAATSNSDNGGDIIINAKTFEALSGGQVATNTRGSGNAGTITLNVQDSLLLSGSDPNFSSRVTSVQQRLQQPGESDQLDDVIFNQGAASGLFANTAIGATGNGGSIFVDPPVVTIRDGAKISVNSDGTGNAGNITLLAGILSLDNGASISAQTASSQGGNINLQLGRLLLLRRNSQISTSAGTASAGGDGGNLTINSPFIVSVPGENNDISANAYSGKGGNIRINTQGIFGITTRQRSTSNSDITASSQLGVQGQIAIDQPEVQRNQEAVELPEQVLDASNQIDQTCAKGNVARSIGEFYVTGRGSLPPNPLEPLAGTADLTVLATLDGEVSAEVGIGETRETRGTRGTLSEEIVEAQGWVKTADGQIALVAVAPEVTPSAVTTSAMCHISQSKQLGTSR